SRCPLLEVFSYQKIQLSLPLAAWSARENAMKPAQIFMLTLVAMIALAVNSLLCRLALKQTSIDAASFTFIRIFSGATALWLIFKTRRKLLVDRTVSPLVDMSSDSSPVTRHLSLRRAGNWPSALALFAYAAAFSFAY